MRILFTIRKQFTYACKVSLILFPAILLNQLALAQIGIFIASGDSVYIHANDTASFFSNVEAQGVFASKHQSTLMFYGQNWENKTSSRFPGNGWFVFAQPSSLGQDSVQTLGGAVWDNRFPNVRLKNANNLHLTSVAGNRDTFLFDTGHVVHNTFDYVVGNNSPGIISDFNQNKYFVTNHNNVSDSGFLIRQTLGHVETVYPVGTDVSDYTPALIVNNGVPDTFAVRVFPNVYAKGDSGTIINDITVARTWSIVESTPGNSTVNLILQHNAGTEGSQYDRNDQYVSRYIGAYNNAYKDTAGASFWDYAASGNGDATSAGTLTSNPTFGFMSQRTGSITTSFGASAPTRYFTKASTASPPVPVELLYFAANWVSNSDAEVKWSTASELNNEKFVLYRSVDGVNYTYVTEQATKSASGNSNEILHYNYLDYTIPTNASVVYYRLEQFDFDNTRSDYGPIALTKTMGNLTLQSKVYPNPARNEMYLTLLGDWKGEFEYQLINVIGEEVLTGTEIKRDYTQTTLIQTTGLRQGNYWLKVSPSKRDVIVKPISVILLN